jgi:predicted O-methyltransferase YrrM
MICAARAERIVRRRWFYGWAGDCCSYNEPYAERGSSGSAEQARRRCLDKVTVPHDLERVLDDAWEITRQVTGFLTEAEARFLGMAAACTPARGEIVEIGSFKGKSSVMLGKLSKHYRMSPIIAIDPHNFNNPQLHVHRTSPVATSFDEFQKNIKEAGVAEFVSARRQYSTQVAGSWDRPIRLLWIDGDHSYKGAKEDFDGFFRHVQEGGVVAFHDALHEDAGPIRVFVEEILRSDQFGAAGFVGSIAWGQFRPNDGAQFREQRRRLDRVAARLLPLVESNRELRGLSKVRYKLTRSRVPRSLPSPKEWAELLNRPS